MKIKILMILVLLFPVCCLAVDRTTKESDYQKAYCVQAVSGSIITNYGIGISNQYKLKSGKIVDCLLEAGEVVEYGYADKSWLTDLSQVMYYAAELNIELGRQFQPVDAVIMEFAEDCPEIERAYLTRRIMHLPVTITEIGPYAYKCNIDRSL